MGLRWGTLDFNFFANKLIFTNLGANGGPQAACAATDYPCTDHPVCRLPIFIPDSQKKFREKHFLTYHSILPDQTFLRQDINKIPKQRRLTDFLKQ